MLVTSKEANKLLKQLEAQRESLLNEEESSKSFLAAVGEDIESCRPEYDFDIMQNDINNIESKIVKIKHSVNKFNSETIIDGFNMTIDEMLVYIPLLTQRKMKLANMANTMPKARAPLSMRSTIIDYRYTNYDIKQAKAKYNSVSDELAKAQIALDTTNITQKFDVDL